MAAGMAVSTAFQTLRLDITEGQIASRSRLRLLISPALTGCRLMWARYPMISDDLISSVCLPRLTARPYLAAARLCVLTFPTDTVRGQRVGGGVSSATVMALLQVEFALDVVSQRWITEGGGSADQAGLSVLRIRLPILFMKSLPATVPILIPRLCMCLKGPARAGSASGDHGSGWS